MELTIEMVLTHYGADLGKANPGRWSKIKCPFHDDTVASASVYLEKGAFACHACDVWGDVLNTIARAEGFGTKENPDRKAASEWAQKIFGEGVKPISRTTNERPKKRHADWRDKLFA